MTNPILDKMKKSIESDTAFYTTYDGEFVEEIIQYIEQLENDKQEWILKWEEKLKEKVDFEQGFINKLNENIKLQNEVKDLKSKLEWSRSRECRCYGPSNSDFGR